MIIHSDGSKKYFSQNSSNHFHSYLQAPLTLNGTWKVALVDIVLNPTGSKTKQNLYIHSDVCGESIVDGQNQNLLRMVRALKVGNWSQTFDSPYYVPVRKSDIRDLEINIKTGKGDLASFVKGRVTITLHFKQYPFLS